MFEKGIVHARMTFKELLTILLEVECTINSRPLTYEYNELEVEMLTPAHLRYGRRLVTVLDELVSDDCYSDEETSMLKRFRYMAKKKRHYWNRWDKEYLTDLRGYHKGLANESDERVIVDDVVLVQEDNVKKGKWELWKN